MGKTRDSANFVSDNNIFTDISNDRTGIGTITPSSKLSVAGDVSAAGNVSSSGQITDVNGNVRAIPNVNKTSSYTLEASDVGKVINTTSGGIIVPQNVFSAGNAVTFYNNSSLAQTITQGANVTLRLAGTTSTGNRSLAGRGIVTIMCVSSNEFIVSGAGIS